MGWGSEIEARYNRPGGIAYLPPTQTTGVRIPIGCKSITKTWCNCKWYRARPGKIPENFKLSGSSFNYL